MADGDAAAETYTLTLTARQRLLLEAALNEVRAKDLAEGLALKGVADLSELEFDALWRMTRDASTTAAHTANILYAHEVRS